MSFRVQVMDMKSNTIYYVMEYFPGGSLDQRIDNKGLPFYEVIKYTRQIGGAIQFMNQNKMLHLDLKPGNVVLDKDNNAILIDFGILYQISDTYQMSIQGQILNNSYFNRHSQHFIQKPPYFKQNALFYLGYLVISLTFAPEKITNNKNLLLWQT